MKNKFYFFTMLSMAVLAVISGGAGFMLAAGTAALANGGEQATDGVPADDNQGIATTLTTDTAAPTLYERDVDKLITKIRPKATPLDNIMRYCKTVSVSAPEYEYWSLGTRPIKTTLKTAITAGAGASITIQTDNDAMFDKDDTIWVVGVKGFKADGTTASDEDLILQVANVDDSGNVNVYAVNGSKANANGVPAIPTVGTVLIRGGRAAAELDAQTAAFANVPTPQIVYCQIFMMQVEQSTIDKMRDKRVPFDFSDMEEDSIFDFRRGQETSLWFGYGKKATHPTKKQRVWFCEGIWWQAGKDITLGTYNSTTKEAEISDDNLVDFERESFTGDGSGSDRKVLFCGSDLMAALGKIKSDKLRLMKENVQCWDLRFKSFDTDFGEILAIYHPGFDEYGMSKEGFLLDPTLLTRVQHLSFARNVVDFDKIAVRNSTAVIMRESLALVLRSPNAHARVKLATS